jgi:hypothetical protein
MHFMCVLYRIVGSNKKSHFLTYLLTYSMQQSTSWEADRFSASQEIPLILWNQRVHYRIHNSPHTYPYPFLSVSLFRNKESFYGKELLAPRPIPKLEDHPLSAVRDCLFNIFAATLHIGGGSSIHNMRTRHTVITGTHLSWISFSTMLKIVTSCLILKLKPNNQSKSFTIIKYPLLLYDYNT